MTTQAPQPKQPLRWIGRVGWFAGGALVAVCLFLAWAVSLAYNDRMSNRPTEAPETYGVRVSEFECVRYDRRLVVTGELHHAGSREVESVEVIASALLDGEVVAQETTAPDFDSLARGERVAFRATITIDGGDWDQCRAEVGEVK